MTMLRRVQMSEIAKKQVTLKCYHDGYARITDDSLGATAGEVLHRRRCRLLLPAGGVSDGPRAMIGPW